MFAKEDPYALTAEAIEEDPAAVSGYIYLSSSKNLGFLKLESSWNFFLGILLCFVRPFRIHMLDSMCLCNRKMNTRLRLFLGLLVYIYIVLETALVVVLKHLAIET